MMRRVVSKTPREEAEQHDAPTEHKGHRRDKKEGASSFATNMCLDVHAEIFGFLEANDQAKLRRTSKHFCTAFNHAFQRGYVAAAIHEGYVDKLDVMHEDGDDAHPLLRVAPVDPMALFWHHGKEIKRSEKDKEATLFVNLRLVLGSAKTVLEKYFLSETSLKAVHVYGTETVEKIEDDFLCQAKVHTFTMTTPCPKLREVGFRWLYECNNLTHFDVSGCCALERVGHGWLFECTALKSASFKGCRHLNRVEYNWMSGCRNLSSIDLGDLVALEEVEHWWLDDCCSLSSVDFSSCRKLRLVGFCWLSKCNAVKTIDLHGCMALEDVWEGFLEDVVSLERILVSKDQKLPSRVTEKVGEELFLAVD